MTEFNLRLKASVEANKFRYGYPWIYSNEIISDRRTKSLLPVRSVLLLIITKTLFASLLLIRIQKFLPE